MLEQTVFLDYAYCQAKNIGEHGVTAKNLGDLQKDLDPVHAAITAQLTSNILGFWGLPGQADTLLAPIDSMVERFKGKVDNLLILGIGGSALGTTATDMALGGSFRLALPADKDKIKIWVADNSDPRMFYALLNRLDPARTAYNVISKSGSTAETMSQFLVVQDRLNLKLGKDKAKEHIIFTTDSKEGALRQLATREGYASLEVPANVGGRFSVLSAVGLFPLALAGHNVRELLEGAREMSERCRKPSVLENPAYMFAAQAVHAMRQGRNILVMMPYAGDLLGMSQWFAQLWGESLGKALDVNGRQVNTGQTPVSAIGATDQHSQLQLYMEGPEDKLICFITLGNYGRDLEIPSLYSDVPSLSYLGGRSMSELIQAEAKATATALAIAGRPSMNLRLPALNARTIGQLLFLLQAATVAAGGMLNVDPLNQPGVELGKKLTYGLMGRDGFAEYKEMLDKQEPDEPWRV